jgi:hypothetical protein
MVRALFGQPVGVSLLSAPPPGVVVVVESPPSSLLLPLLVSPPLLLPPLLLGLGLAELLPPQAALNKTDPRASARVTESTFRNIAMFDWWQSGAVVRQGDTSNHMNLRELMRIFQ